MLLGLGGDDVLEVSEADYAGSGGGVFSRIDGGDGTDTLRLIPLDGDGAGFTADLAAGTLSWTDGGDTVRHVLANLENIDVGGAANRDDVLTGDDADNALGAGNGQQAADAGQIQVVVFRRDVEGGRNVRSGVAKL